MDDAKRLRVNGRFYAIVALGGLLILLALSAHVDHRNEGLPVDRSSDTTERLPPSTSFMSAGATTSEENYKNPTAETRAEIPARRPPSKKEREILFGIKTVGGLDHIESLLPAGGLTDRQWDDLVELYTQASVYVNEARLEYSSTLGDECKKEIENGNYESVEGEDKHQPQHSDADDHHMYYRDKGGLKLVRFAPGERPDLDRLREEIAERHRIRKSTVLDYLWSCK